ncbi:hypothetical protein [Coxiella burnetii]|uniref:hypothetical protein n=1 Tax=Coxiella burnetii TaxID=777 RepID=UPI000163A3C3|nr:hypothetical protein [Coxiella burnetii]ATN85955.1 hypothetical protein AYO29_05625 [Coxiella burnetii str. Schperling]EDR35353.1 conserved hypothetical protein [Coxiella burnetii Q321]
MNEKTAFNLIQQYIEGWKQNDLLLILSTLAEDCVVIESHGPQYFCEKKETAFVEWAFGCVSNGREYALPGGISVVKFSDQKIAFLHEYRMTRAIYRWEGKRLNSD